MGKEKGSNGDKIGILKLEARSQAERQWESLFNQVYVRNKIAGKSIDGFSSSFRFDEDGPIDYTAQVIPMGMVTHKPHFITVLVLRNDDMVMAGMASADWNGNLPRIGEIKVFGGKTKEMELDPLLIASMGHLTVSPQIESLTHVASNVDFPMRPQSRVH